MILACMTALSYASGGNISQEDKVPYLGTSNYLLLNIGGGMHTHLFDAEGGDSKQGWDMLGSLFEIKYQHTPKHWGIGLGLQMCYYRSEATFNHNYEGTFTHDDNNLSYRLNTRFVDWKEGQEVWAIEIPLSLQYTSKIGKKWDFLMGAGLTVSIPIIKHFNTHDGYFITSGWFESTNVEYEDLTNHGFHTDESSQSGKIDGMAVSLGTHAEVGFNRMMGKKSAFYMGLYVHYSLTNSVDSQESNLYDGYNYIGAFDSKQVEEVHPFKTGVKLGLRFDLKDKEREKEAKEIVERRKEERERQKEIAAAAEQMRIDHIRQQQQERSLRKEEKDRLLQQQTEKAEAIRKAALKEKNEAIYALKKIADEAIYAYPNSIPTFPEEIERSFDVIYTYLAKNSNASILVTGHTDNTIKEDKSIVIGQKRAESFKKALIRKGIPEDKIECASKGNTQPVASNNTKGGRELNNRTELSLKLEDE